MVINKIKNFKKAQVNYDKHDKTPATTNIIIGLNVRFVCLILPPLQWRVPFVKNCSFTVAFI